ncbi:MULTISPECIES: ribosomal protein S18-alanine N-acetyltransferase [unclassified Nocardioides]|uniref:ribosomal protein S18-alanine N-acetyltransferase n=1 Tax=unclassified Nocardioides TaxID=2615069 RepID=UPI0011504C81|nr:MULTISPECIES: ribosomal protein S18-alanine N-acetyltransferase [unclassified Nocardioides]TQK72653.1 ribosomal-protein-alanine N-acetyltransferase [Nocardioides sp. SLBN-35]WGY03144.1 ribosomal protein S18-alanine N-acetyltransferase [Nocardioides sp. QY071]
MTTTTRPAAVADVAAIVALEADAFPLDPWSENLVGEGVGGALPTVAYLVAEEAGAFAGYAVVSVVDVDAELQRIAVPEELRRTGVATALLSAVRATATDGGAERLLLEVREDNLAARLFYERHGFAELGRRPRYYRDGTDALVLSARVP